MFLFKIKNNKFKNKKGMSLADVVVSVLILMLVMIGVLQIIQYSQKIKQINTFKQEISQLQEYILGYLDVYNEKNKEKENKGNIDFEKNVRKKFLSIFSDAESILNNPNGKVCYSIESNSGGLNFNKLTLDSSGNVVIDNNLYINGLGYNGENTEYTYSYPTVLCLINGYEYIDFSSNKNTNKGPILAYIISDFYIGGESKQIQLEKMYYFDEK